MITKARLAIITAKNKNAALLLIQDYKKLNNQPSKIAIIYCAALADYQAGKYQQAKQQLQPLLDSQPDNLWFIDLMTDIDLELNNNSVAITRLQQALKKFPNSTAIQLNLAAAYNNNKNYQQAVSLLHRYTHDHNDDMNGWDELIKAYGGLHSTAQQMTARAELIALQGRFDESIQLLQNAKNRAKGDQITLSKIDARINQLKQMQKRFAKYKR